MEHEDFVRRAAMTARNAQGVRPLARQVRLLYDDIRALQDDDNAYFYMAEVIAAARGDKLDVGLIADRIRVYHYRDRKRRGDKPIGRGSDRTVDPDPPGRRPTGTAQVAPPPIWPAHGAGAAKAPGAETTPPVAGQPLVPATDQAPPRGAGAVADDPPVPAGQEPEPQPALTRTIYQRSGRRRVVEDG